ncbi:methyl-accepting chemotaxis protein [Stieleria varia]|uniref:Methyl-accepting chemotaxis protein 3 n=1 Tax=Stieleria varia TaxID=2528005 RepID=A0A5C5ZLL4_9BACT|nr:methyl-accepting chemotaxis protein [Stieleria varia]TWT88065.1 Methyl-accepting chemotaxis protein 3 [Stieleria varia]
MKAHLLFALSHGLVAVVAVASVLASASVVTAPAWVIVAIASFATSIICGFMVSTRICRAATTVQDTLNHREPKSNRTGIAELDQVCVEVQERAKHYENVEANERQHSREIKSVLSRLSRRDEGGQPDITLLKNVLGGIGRSLSGMMNQIEQDVLQIGRCTREISSGSTTQTEIASRTEASIMTLSQSIQEASRRADSIAQQITEITDAIGAAMDKVGELSDGVNRIRSCSETSKKKLRSLCDPTRQISNLVSTIGDVASHTELLALNASIESIRAGEHGRSFAVVADEIRKLAGQTAAASNEIGILVESLEAQTNDSIAILDKESREVDNETVLIAAIAESLHQLTQMTHQSIDKAHRLASENAQQQQSVQSVLSGVESLCGVGQTDRNQAGNASWAVKSLAKATIELDSTIHRLRGCNEVNAPPEASRDPQLIALAQQINDPASHDISSAAAARTDREAIQS